MSVWKSTDGVTCSGETLLVSYCKWNKARADVIALIERDKAFNEWWEKEYLSKYTVKFPISFLHPQETIQPSVKIFWDEGVESDELLLGKKQTLLERIVSWLKGEKNE